jgi:hypothetical protein
MASAVVSTTSEKQGPFVNPWPWMIAGLAAAATAALWALVFKEALTPLRVTLVFAGVLAAGIGVILKPNAVAVLGCAAAAAALGAFGLYLKSNKGQWDSIRLVLAVAAAIAVLAAVIVALPRLWRRIVVSLLIVLHFGGILSAVTSAHAGSWVASVAYTYFYRPYLEFFYLTNAYHFYAPEPGPAYLLWFRIEYTKDDSKTIYSHWHEIPALDDEGRPNYLLALQYQRRLALTMLSAQGANQMNQPPLEAAKQREKANLDRYRSGQPIIPRHPNAQVGQYAVPTPITRRVISSYVRHVAHVFQSEHPEARIKHIKMYRIVHSWLSAGDMAAGFDPQDPCWYYPYFWGKFDAAGTLIDEQDPFLYCILPFLRVRPDQSPYFEPDRELIPREPKETRPRMPVEEEDQFKIDVYRAVVATAGETKNYKIFGYMFLHAGDTKWVRHSGDKKWKEE